MATGSEIHLGDAALHWKIKVQIYFAFNLVFLSKDAHFYVVGLVCADYAACGAR